MRRARAGAQMATWFVPALLVAGVLSVCAGAAEPAAAADQQALEKLLSRLGLVDLQVFQLEQQLASAEPDAGALARARRLADLFAGQLMAAADDQDRYGLLVKRIQKLLEQFPQANTTALQVMLLQADYNQAESRIAEWIADPQLQSAKDAATATLTRITPQLDKYQQTLDAQLKQLETRADELPDGDALRMLEQQMRRQQRLTARSTYFAAWANYYLSMLRAEPVDAAGYQRARELFRELLGISDLPLDEVTADSIGLASVWRARALIGLGLAEAASDHADASERCFEILEDSSVAAPIRDQAPYWHLRALLQRHQWQAVRDLAQRVVQSFTRNATQGAVSFCVALVRIGYGTATTTNPSDPSMRTELGRLGLLGLAKLGQLSAVDTLLEKYKIAVDTDAGFILLWARGQKQFADAEKSKDPAGYTAAVASLRAALASDDAGILPGPAARCRYTLAWCAYRQGDMNAAAAAFAQAAGALREANESLAPESAWMAFVTLRQLSKTQPSALPKATTALNRIKRDFPNSSYAKRVDLEMARLMAGSTPEKSMAFLESIKPSDRTYESSRYELCLLWHQRWRQAKDEASAAASRAALRRAADSYLRVAKGSESQDQIANACLMVIESLLRPPVDTSTAADYLQRVAQATDKLPDSDPLVSAYHFRALQLASRGKDATQQRRHAQWLADHGAGTPYEQAALIVVAKSLDQTATAAGARATQDTLQQAHEAYLRLAKLLGTTPDKLATNKNSRVAASRAAYYARMLKKPEQAADLLEQLLVAYPKDRSYLRRAALAAFDARQYERSLQHWRTLLAGLPRGRTEWLEAKYYQLRCLAATDPDRAARVYHQFQLLYPDLGGAAWRAKFTSVMDRR